MNPRDYLTALAGCLVLSLAACGGGGGTAGTAMKVAPMKVAPTPRSVPSLDEARAADPEGEENAARAVASNLPRFGSVVQSSNGNGGVTTDAVGTKFDGTSATVTITREDSGSLSLDTAHALEDGGVRDRDDGHDRRWGLVRATNEDFYVARLNAVWAQDDPSDYMVYGWWAAGDGDLRRPSTVTTGSVGAFADGPEISGPPANLPGLGTASYEGNANGFYVARLGSGWGAWGLPDETSVAAEWAATATLTADFADGTIQGCIGCEGGVDIEGIAVNGATGQTADFRGNSPAQINLVEAGFTQDGTFRTTAVTYTALVDVPAGTPATPAIERTSGSWGGRFSNIPADDGAPRLVAGTVASQAEYADGSRVILVGAFGAGKQ